VKVFIVKILKVAKNGTKFIVTTDSTDYSFTEDVIVKYIISKNKQYTKEQFDEIVSFSKVSEFYNKVLNFLSFKERSIKEVEEYLKKKECLFISVIIDKLLEDKLLDDERYCKNMLESVITSKKGPIFLKRTLKLKGVDENFIEDIMYEFTEETVVELLNEIIDKELRKIKIVSLVKYLSQLKQILVRSGFMIRDINHIINERLDEIKEVIDEESAIEKEFKKFDVKDIPKQKLIKKLCDRGFNYQDVKKIVNN